MISLRKLLSEFDASKASLLFLLIGTDLILIALYFIYELTPWLPSRIWDISEERSLGELFQYLKFFLIAAMLFAIYRVRHELLYGAWALVYFYFFLDDAFQIHEQLGQAIVAYTGLGGAFGLRGQDFAELMVSGVVAGPLLLLLILGYRSGSQAAKSVSKDLSILVAALLFFGMLLDTFHIGLSQYPKLYGAFNVLEDGGEMIVMSFTSWYVFCLLKERGMQVGIPGKLEV